jgi:hypothetical protein
MRTTAFVSVLIFFAATAFGQVASPSNSGPSATTHRTSLDDTYSDQSHCLALPEIRSHKDDSISCYCRDAIVEARYVYFTYLLSAKDRNLNGPFLSLQQRVGEICGEDSNTAYAATEGRDWSWNGPEVVRTYPPEDAIDRISPEMKDGKTTDLRWVPYTVQLVFRDADGHVRKTENYSTRELDPVSSK